MEPVRKRLITVGIILMFLLFLPCSTFARGQREDPMIRARELVSERRYNDAIMVLVDVMKNHPERFDQAEELLTQVREIRDQYNRYYAELIQVLDPAPGEAIDEDRAYELIQRMEDLDRDPNQAALEAFSEMRASIVFAINDRAFRTLLEDAMVLLENQEWDEAVSLYLSGFNLHRELFLERSYDDTIFLQVDDLRESVIREAERFIPQRADTDSSAGNLLNILEVEEPASAAEEAGDAVQELKPLLLAVEERREQLLEYAVLFDQLRETLQREEENDIPYLSTMRVLTRGRATAEEPEGISGTILRYWEEWYDTLYSRAYDLTENSYQEAVAAYNRFNYDSAGASFELTRSFAAHTEEITSLRSSGTLEALEELSGQVQQELLPVRSLDLSAQQFSLLNSLRREIEQENQNWESMDEASLVQRRERILALGESISEIPVPFTPFENILGRLQESLSVEKPAAFIDQVKRAVEEAEGDLLAMERESVLRRSNIRLGGLQDRLDTAAETLPAAEAAVQGVPEIILEGSDPIEVKRPDQAVALIERVDPQLQELDNELNNFLQELRAEPQTISTYPSIAELAAEAERERERIRVLRSRGQTVLTEAQALNRSADIALAEGNLRLSEAQAQMERENFEQARARLEQAGSALALSLTYREDPQVRARIDQEIPALAERIITEQNRLIVRQVRELIIRGRELFFQENFILAEQTFQRAQARWLQTNTEEEPEVNAWLERVRRALETTTGVELAVADPLYPEMTQMLNLARRDFQEGERLLQAGNREAARRKFAEAEQKIEYVKEPFPNNQLASVIYLQILQYTQPEDFDTIFSSRFNTARRQITSEPEEAYRELKILEAIRPDHTGMEQAIYNAEIATGIRQPPPDPARLARARELYNDANRIVVNDIRAQFPVAVAYLNEAINLNPDYDQAIILKDRIQAGSGGAVTVVLSSVAQQQLKQAEDLFIQGRFFEASVIVSQLLQDPVNRRNPQLLELQRRIQARL
jgi:hypothetical protein